MPGGPEYTRPLSELRRDDEPTVGGKSASLGELLAADIPVPPGFAVSTGAFAAFLDDGGLVGRIEESMARVSAGDVDAIGAASHAISESMHCSARLFDDGIIDPRDSRRVLLLALETCLSAGYTDVRPNSFGVARF